MNPFRFARRRPLTTLILVAILAGGGVIGVKEMHADTGPPSDGSKSYIDLESLGERVKEAQEYIVGQFESESEADEEHGHEEARKIVATRPAAMDVVVTQPYVCQIHSQRHIEVRALEGGYLQEILVKEGQPVRKGDLMFRILPTLYKARLDAEKAEAELARLEYNNTKALSAKRIVSQNEVMLLKAKLDKAQAKADLASAEMNFTEIRAPFDGIVDRLHRQLGSLIDEGEDLTTLSDNSVMWVYFNVPEARYLEYKKAGQENGGGNTNQLKLPDSKIELLLADDSTFGHDAGDTVIVEGKFNNETGNIAFRADFPNPERLLRHGQTGKVLIHRTFKDAVVIPQRATFELLDKQYAYVIGDDDVVHQRLITVQHVLEDTFVIGSGLEVADKIVLEGIREVRDGDKVEYELEEPGAVLAHQKHHAE